VRQHGSGIRPSPSTASGSVPPPSTGASRLLRRIAVAPIVAYQRLISPALPRRCRYEPTCSAYAVRAVREYGILRGLVLAGWRLLRCNPWSHGGFDPPEAQRLFRR
jgi:uncharacterized protein